MKYRSVCVCVCSLPSAAAVDTRLRYCFYYFLALLAMAGRVDILFRVLGHY